MITTGIVAGLGFIFWFTAAHLYTTTQLGLATTLISVMNMISLLSLLGFDVAFIRFLPSSENKDLKINTGFIVVGAMSITLSTLFLLFIHSISPQLDFIRASALTSVGFVFFALLSTLNLLTDSIFVSARKTKYSLIVNTSFCLFRLGLPFLFISWGAWGIYMSVALAQAVGCMLSFGILMWHFNYRPALVVSREVLARVGGYSMTNYLGVICNLLPSTLLPIIVLNHLGPESAAFYYVVMMFGNLLYAIPFSTTRALFAEGVHDQEALLANAIKSAKIIAILLVPAMLVLVFAGDQVLHLFGKTYSAEGFTFLRIVAVTGIAVSTSSILGSFFRVTKNPKWLIVINFFFAVTVLGLSYVLLPYGLTGIGIAWFAGYVVASTISFSALRLYRLFFYRGRLSYRRVPQD